MVSLAGLEGGARPHLINDSNSSVKGIESNIASHQTVLSVSDALRIHSGSLKVHGMISSISALCKMISGVYFKCPTCGNVSGQKRLQKAEFELVRNKKVIKCFNCPDQNLLVQYDYVNAVTIELMDTDTFNDLERLPVILFENDTRNILAGQRVRIEGDMYIVKSNNKYKSYPCIYSRSIEYESKHDIVLTEKDIAAIERFTHLKGNNKIIDELVGMFAPFVIGYQHVKQGLLLSAASCGNDLKLIRQNRQRVRLPSLLVGEPGNAKSALLRAATKLVPNSRYENCQSSSIRSLTAIVVKEESEKEFVRLGPVPLAHGAICALNELGRMPFEDQAHLLDVMEEGEFGINKYGLNSKISSPTVIIASANPISTYWRDSEKVSLDEFPISKVLLDRFDLIFFLRTTRDVQAIRDYAYKKSELIDENRPLPNYNSYIQKHIMYCKQLNPTLSKEAKMMLAEYYIKIARRSGSPRILETLHRIAKATARLKLKNVVDAEDAEETMKFYNVMLQQLDQIVAVTSNPRVITCNECLNILEQHRNPITFIDIIRAACKRNEYVRLYIGDKYKLQENKKLRSIVDMLLSHSSVRSLMQKPLLLQWSNTKKNDTVDQTEFADSNYVAKESVYDLYDPYDLTKSSKDNVTVRTDCHDNQY